MSSLDWLWTAELDLLKFLLQRRCMFCRERYETPEARFPPAAAPVFNSTSVIMKLQLWDLSEETLLKHSIYPQMTKLHLSNIIMPGLTQVPASDSNLFINLYLMFFQSAHLWFKVSVRPEKQKPNTKPLTGLYVNKWNKMNSSRLSW